MYIKDVREPDFFKPVARFELIYFLSLFYRMNIQTLYEAYRKKVGRYRSLLMVGSLFVVFVQEMHIFLFCCSSESFTHSAYIMFIHKFKM